MTQTQLNSLLACVVEQAKQAGIPVSTRICPTVSVNRRAKTRFGCCRTRNGVHTIEIAAALLEADERVVRQVLAHEVLHTCPGCANHGTLWKGYATRMNDLCGYDICRTDSHQQLGLSDDRPVRWLVVCRSCGKELPRMKRSALVEHPERYRCRCGGTLYVKAAPQAPPPSVK